MSWSHQCIDDMGQSHPCIEDVGWSQQCIEDVGWSQQCIDDLFKAMSLAELVKGEQRPRAIIQRS